MFGEGQLKVRVGFGEGNSIVVGDSAKENLEGGGVDSVIKTLVKRAAGPYPTKVFSPPPSLSRNYRASRRVLS